MQAVLTTVYKSVEYRLYYFSTVRITGTDNEMTTHERILTAGTELFLKRGYKGVTTDAVAKRARVSKNTLYAVFPSKAALMEAIILSLLEESMHRWDTIISGPERPLDKLRVLFPFFTEILPHLQERIFSPVAEFDPSLWQRIEKLRDERLQRMKALIVMAQRAGLVRADLNPDLWLTLLMGVANAVVNPKMLIATNLSYRELMRTIGVVFFEGILTTAGRKEIARKE